MKKKLLKYVLAFLIFNCIMICILSFAYIIPREKTMESVEEAYDQYLQTGLYVDDYDGYTDALMLSTTIVSPIQSNEKGLGIIGFALSNNVSREGIMEYDPLNGLEKLIAHDDRYASYSNYFVISTVLYRILLSVFSLDTVRFFLQMITLYGVAIESCYQQS